MTDIGPTRLCRGTICRGKIVTNNTVGLRRLMLVALLGQLFATDAPAAGGSFTLAPGEVAWVVIGSTNREIRICNGLESAGDSRAETS